MALEDIEKLKEKVAKDPNSKLFVPLADEYRKMGMFDEAISVLLKGLNNQPGYVSARVSLGKVYLEKNMVAEAKQEFEKVISAIPDNLFAHKKLAEIYRDSGDREKAIEEYRRVLKLNPLDGDVITNLEALQDKPTQPAPEELPVEETAALSEVVEMPAEIAEIEEAVEILSVAESVAEEEMAEVEEGVAIFADVTEEEIPVSVQMDELEGFKKGITEHNEEVEEVVAEEVVPEEDIDIGETEKEALAFVDMFKEKDSVVEKKEPLIEEPSEKEVTPVDDLKDAELFISDGNYSKAMKIYRGMLSIAPDNRHVLQKVAELKMLLKILGKEHDIVIDRLKAFEEGLKKRRDDFLRSP